MVRRHSVVLTILATLLVFAAVGPAAVAARPFPDELPLPDGFAPEGIATGRGTTFYTGSLSGQGIWHGDYRSGAGSPLVIGGGPFVGMTVDDHNRLWVAGGPAGLGHIFDADTGAVLETFAFASGNTFVNDVVVTGDAAYFTDSFRPVLYRVAIGAGGTIGAVETVELDETSIGFVPGAFNLNGIVATPDGQVLIAVNLTAGNLYAIDSATGEAEEIDLGADGLVSAGDGLLLHGRSLYVVRNQLNVVAVVELAPDLATGAVVDELTSSRFDVPTTIARFGASLYVVNARFGTPVTADTEYWVTRVTR